jgi:hypothetical protein
VELGPLQVEVSSNERRYSAGGFGVNEELTNDGAGGQDRQISAISCAVEVVKTTRIAATVIPDHRHGTRVAGDVKRRDTATANDDGKKRGAILIRGRQKDLTSGPPDVTKDRIAREDPRFLNESNVPRKVGQVSPTSLKRGHINRQNNRAGARAGGLTNEDLPAVASLRTTRRTVQKDPSGSLTTARRQ